MAESAGARGAGGAEVVFPWQPGSLISKTTSVFSSRVSFCGHSCVHGRAIDLLFDLMIAPKNQVNTLFFFSLMISTYSV